MTFDEALAFWYGRINYEVKSARPSDLKLERMRAFLDRIGNPQDRLRIVHVTGTKGKGSTVAMLASVLQTAGYRVGQFTSPHLVAVNERMRVCGVPISNPELAALIEELAPTIMELEANDTIGLSYFEIGTAIGFLHFVRRRVEIAIVEVGMGGRFDSTNVCKPLVSVITSVGFDHMAQLGRTLPEIAFQKAGIIKRGVPVVCGVNQVDATVVIEGIAQELSAPLALAGRDFRYDYRPPRTVRVATHTTNFEDLALRLPGEHQAGNAASAVATLEHLRTAGLTIPDSAIRRGLESALCPGRIETIRENPAVVLDTAHNVPSAIALVRTLRESFPGAKRKVCVFAVSSDKQYAEILAILGEYFDEFILTRYSNNSRSVSPEQLLPLVAKPATVHPLAAEAWKIARSTIGESDLICITGSVFLAGELNGAVRV